MKLQNDYSALKKLPLDITPVGVAFAYYPPEGIEPLDEALEMSFCEMLRYCQTEKKAFYFSRKNVETCVGKGLLGMEMVSGTNGEKGKMLGVFDDARANMRTGKEIPTMPPGSTNFVLFSPVDKLTFEPDVLVFAAKQNVAEMILRAYSYSTGDPYCSKCTPVAGCAWTMIYPYQSGKINFVVPAFVHGMHGRKLWEEGIVLVGIPYNCIGTVLTNLNRMDLVLNGHTSKEEYYRELNAIHEFIESNIIE